MSRFQTALLGMRRHFDPKLQPIVDATDRYLANGDPGALQLVVASKDRVWYLASLAHTISRPGTLDQQERRLLSLIAAMDRADEAAAWFRSTTASADEFLQAIADLKHASFSQAQIDSLALHCADPTLDHQGQPTIIGKYILEMDALRLKEMLAKARADRQPLYRALQGLLKLFFAHAPQWADLLLAIAKQRYDEATLCQLLLTWFGNKFEPMAADCFKRKQNFQLGLQLAQLDPQRYSDDLAKLLPAYIAHAGLWESQSILPVLKSRAVDPFVDAVVSDNRYAHPDNAKFVVEQIAKHGQDRAQAGLLKVLEQSPSPIVRAAALEHLVEMNDPALNETLENAIEKGMEGDPRDAARFAVLAARFAGGRLRERLWQDLASKSKLRRDAAAEALAAGDPAALDRAAGMLTDKSKDARWGAVLVLGKLKNEQAIDCLLNYLPREQAEEVRESISRSLREAGVGLETIVKHLGPVDLNKLRETGAKLDLPEWISESDLPGMRMLDGQALDMPLVRFLLHRQSRQKEPIVDPEAAPVYALIDRKTSGDFAFKLLNAFLEADAPKPHAWALITAGLLGDNRVITTLATKVRGWAQDSAQKQGEWGVEALALNGSDAALMAVESIASKFKDNPRRKFKVIGEAAQNAFEFAAKRMGISMDALADRTVPTLGFEPGKPRRIEAGKRIIEATIGLDFKLAMKDLETGKRAVSIPKTAPADVVAEFKGLPKLLLEVSRSQSARLENRMVSQYRWPANRWRLLFLEHPILFPFAVRLLWGEYSDKSDLISTFRALPDRTLTDASDEPVGLASDEARIGIVHPLDLSPEQRDAWRTHLADYEIEPPFPQIDRPVMRLNPEQADLKTYDDLKGAQLNALGFRSKSERSGWMRGAVGDGAMIGSYRKRFPNLRIDAFVTVDGLPVYTDPTAQATIGSILFLPADTSPRDFAERQMRLGDVPAMAFSEAVGDIARICGRAS